MRESIKPAGVPARVLLAKSLSRMRGLGVVEVVAAVAGFTVLTLTAVPAVGAWVSGAPVRTAVEALESGLHRAQIEAAQRNRTVQFTRTDADPAGSGPWPASEDGRNWVIVTLPRIKLATGGDNSPERIAGSTLATADSGIAISGPATVSFNAFGMVSGASGTGTFSVRRSPADAPVNIVVSVGGVIRSCSDLETGKAEGC